MVLETCFRPFSRSFFVFHIRCGLIRSGCAHPTLDYVQSQIDAGRQTGRRGDCAVVNKARPSYDVNPGKLLLELVAKIVVSGCCQAIEKTRSCKLKCAGAD